MSASQPGVTIRTPQREAASIQQSSGDGGLDARRIFSRSFGSQKGRSHPLGRKCPKSAILNVFSLFFAHLDNSRRRVPMRTEFQQFRGFFPKALTDPRPRSADGSRFLSVYGQQCAEPMPPFLWGSHDFSTYAWVFFLRVPNFWG